MAISNREYKNSVFTDYFSDKERLIDAYNAIAGTDFPNTAEIEFQTLENVLYGEELNDIAFTIEDRYVVLIEHQSTVNENMPLRMLLYIARVYERIVPHRMLYKKNLRTIPTPEFIVIYNGTDPYPEKTILKLSDAFHTAEKNVNLELTVPVYNITMGNNAKMLEKSKALSDYAAFVTVVQNHIKDGLERDEAIEKAVFECSKRGIMETYLAIHGSEVRNMLLDKWDMNEAYEVWREEAHEEGHKAGLEEGHKEGLEQGLEQGKLETAQRMKAKGIEDAVIAECTGLSEDKIIALVAPSTK